MYSRTDAEPRFFVPLPEGHPKAWAGEFLAEIIECITNQLFRTCLRFLRASSAGSFLFGAESLLFNLLPRHLLCELSGQLSKAVFEVA